MRFIAALLLSFTAGAVAMAHGDNEHVRGTITQLSSQAITVRTTANATKTLTLSEKTTFLRSVQKAALADLKVGERVVIDVPKGTSQAIEIQFGAAAPKPAAHDHATAKK